MGDRVVSVVEAATGNVLRQFPLRELQTWRGTLPVWSPNGRYFTAIHTEGFVRDSIWIFDANTQEGRLAVEFPGRFHMIFRAAWGQDAKSLIVNRDENVSHIALIENF